MKAKSTMALSLALATSAGTVVIQTRASGMPVTPPTIVFLALFVLADTLLFVSAHAAIRNERRTRAPVAERVSRECGLSTREREVLEKYLDVRDIRTCANELFISPGTVKTHLSHIYGKTGVTGCHELLDFCDALTRAA